MGHPRPGPPPGQLPVGQPPLGGLGHVVQAPFAVLQQAQGVASAVPRPAAPPSALQPGSHGVAIAARPSATTPALAAAPPPAAPSPVLVSLAAATRSIVPASSRREAPRPRPQSTTFLNADRETQTLIMRDRSIAQAIFQDLGNAAATSALARPAEVASASAPAAPAQVDAARVAPASSTGLASSRRDDTSHAWKGGVTLTRSSQKHLRLQASLLHGKAQLVEPALRAAGTKDGALNISHRVPFDDLARHVPVAVLSFAPMAPPEQTMYDEYVRYFRTRCRCGVSRLDDSEALYIVPSCEEASALLKSLEASSQRDLALPRNVLLGIIAPAPERVGNAPEARGAVGTAAETAIVPPTEPVAKAVSAATAAARSGAPEAGAAATPAAPPAAPEAAAAVTSAALSALVTSPLATAKASIVGGDFGRTPSSAACVRAAVKMDECTRRRPARELLDDIMADLRLDGADDAKDEELSSEVLSDLFSNPDLIRSLQALSVPDGKEPRRR